MLRNGEQEIEASHQGLPTWTDEVARSLPETSVSIRQRSSPDYGAASQEPGGRDRPEGMRYPRSPSLDTPGVRILSPAKTSAAVISIA
jgi:hypothetical protein